MEPHILKSPILDILYESEQVPEHIKLSFSQEIPITKNRHKYQKYEYLCVDTNHSSIEHFVYKILDEDDKRNMLAEFYSYYLFNQQPKKLEAVNAVCGFCLAACDRSQFYKYSLCLKNKLLNYYFLVHKKCFESFLCADSKQRLIVLGELTPIYYVLMDESEEEPEFTIKISRSILPSFKYAFIEFTILHPISNFVIFYKVKKVIIEQGEGSEGMTRTKFNEGRLYDPDRIVIPYDSYRLQIRMSIQDMDYLHNKYQVVSIISSKKFKVLPSGQPLSLKINGKKATYCIHCTTTNTSAIQPQSPTLKNNCTSPYIDIHEVCIKLMGIFAYKKKLHQVINPHQSTYSDTGAARKRKKDDFGDLSPDIRSTNKSLIGDAPNQKYISLKKYDSAENVSFKYHKKYDKSDKSRLSCISRDLNMEEIQNELKNSTLHTYLKTQSGSRNLQKYISKCNEQDIDMILQSIEQHINQLMLDQYANFFFKTLCYVCSPKHRVLIMSKVQKQIEEIARDKKGTHTLQALVSMISTQNYEKALFQILYKSFVALSRDEQGTHVIKKMLPRLTDTKIVAFFDKMAPYLFELSQHQYGIIVIKYLIGRVRSMPYKRQYIFSVLYKSFDEMIYNPYGNYAIQHVIEIYPLKYCYKIISKILSKLAAYSNQKISSNVVYKCIMNTNDEIKGRFIVVLSRDYVIVELMRGKFGNFVLEKALKTSSKTYHKNLMKAMQKNIESIGNVGMKQKWQDYLDDYQY